MPLSKIPDSEYRFCLILWKHEPISIGELIKLCEAQLGWKRTTTYTVIKRLSERHILRNDQGKVYALISKEEMQRQEMKHFVREKFEGSLPDFVAAFTHEASLSPEEMKQMQKMIEAIREGE